MRKKVNLLSLSKNELKNVKGAAAAACEGHGCHCNYDGTHGDDYYGGSSSDDNHDANAAAGLHSPAIQE